MKKWILFPLLIMFLLSITACSDKTNKYTKYENLQDNRKPISWGQDRVIYVFADEEIWKYAETPLRETLERYEFTNNNESYFELRRADIENIAQFYKFRNLIFLSNINSNLPVSAFVKKSLPLQTIQETVKNRVGLYKDQNLWANDQQVLFITGDNLLDLMKITILQKEQIFRIFSDRLHDRIAFHVYQMPVLDDSFFQDYPFTLKIPVQYRLYKKDVQGHFISFLYRNLHEDDENPDKYISVYYEEMDSYQVTQDWLIKRRAEFAWKYFDEDTFKREDINISQVSFQGRTSWLVAGRWQNQKYKIGGAFRSIAFWDETQKKAYIIDSSVFYPAGEKLTYLLELRAISESFMIKK